MTGAELREIRRRLGWSQARLAEELRTTQATVSRWEGGTYKVHPLAAEKVRELEQRHRKEDGAS